MSTEDRESRNAVFSNAASVPSGVDHRTPMQSATDKVKAEFGLDIPLETVPLPSSGKVYAQGKATKKRDAEKQAATLALKKLGLI